MRAEPDTSTEAWKEPGLSTVKGTVDGSEILYPLIGSSSNYFQDFLHPSWLFGISSINSMD